MISRNTVTLVVMAAIIVVLFWLVVWFGRDEYQELAREHGETIGSQGPVEQNVGPGRIKLDANALRASGIVTAKVVAAESRAQLEVQGVIVDTRPLIDARGRYLAQQAEIRALRAAATASEAEYKRMLELYKDERNVSERTMLAAEAQWKGDRARLNSAEQAALSQAEAIRAQWGSALAQLAIGSSPAAFSGIAAQTELVAEVSIPLEQDRTTAKNSITLEPTGGGKTVSARLLSAAPASTVGAAGATYFYRVPSTGLRIGTRVAGRVPLSNSPSEKGVKVPDGAVVWHAGSAWIYVREKPDEFVRTPLETDRQLAGGWFTGEAIDPGTEIVVTGAQLLLSEELKYQIRNENED